MAVNNISGQNGVYDNKITDSNVKYGRNAVSNYFKFMDDFKNRTDRSLFQPLEKDVLELREKTSTAHQTGTAHLHEKEVVDLSEKVIDAAQKDSARDPIDSSLLTATLKYLPENVGFKNLNKKALLGASFEDLGKKTSESVSTITQKLNDAFKRTDLSAEAFDVNSDGNIDVAENAVAFLIKDMASKQPTEDVLKSGKIELEAHNIDGTITAAGEKNFLTFLKKSDIANNKNINSEIYNAFDLASAQEEFLKDPSNLAS